MAKLCHLNHSEIQLIKVRAGVKDVVASFEGQGHSPRLGHSACLLSHLHGRLRHLDSLWRVYSPVAQGDELVP
jgi:hypothetical protein